MADRNPKGGPMFTEEKFDGVLYDQRRSMLAQRIEGEFRARARDNRILHGKDQWLCLTDGEGFFLLTDDEVDADWRRVSGGLRVVETG